MEKQYVVYNPYEKEEEFEGTFDECQAFLASYGGGWSALQIVPLEQLRIEQRLPHWDNQKRL